METLEAFFASLGLLWERTHLITAATVQAPGVHCAWTTDLEPIGARVVPAGQMVELRASLDAAQSVADTGKARFDVLEQDWLFTGGFDDPVASLKPASADPPEGQFAIEERVVETATLTAELPTLRDVVTDYKRVHADDYDRGILVVTDPTPGSTFGTEIVAWWRAQHVDESDPSLYFIAEIPGHRCGTVNMLKVAPLQPGANVRLIGEVRDSVPPALADAAAVPGAVVAAGSASARTDRAGGFGLDVRVPFGASRVTVTRPGIDPVTCTVTATQRGDGGIDVAVTDPTGSTLDTASIAPDATLQDFARLDITVRPLVHRVSGTVSWPATWALATALPLAGRTVCVLPLQTGAALPQRPATSRAWEALRSRDGVVRATTAADGTFTVRLVDLSPGAQHLVWLEEDDPRGGRAFDVIVRTVAAPGMRTLAFAAGGAMAPQRNDRRVVDSTYNLLAGTVAGCCDVLRVGTDTHGALTVERPGRANPAGFDATPVTDADALVVDAATKHVTGLQLEVLPLVPVFEAADDQGVQATRVTTALHRQLDASYPRGHLADGIRWVLDARRGRTATWNDATACAALETTLLTHRLLAKSRIDDPAWPWWRADAVSAADYAQVTLGAGATFAGRTLAAELVPVLVPAVPRLLGLFDRRYAHVTPGHGVFAQPPEIATGATDWSIHTNRGLWAGNDPQGATVTQNYAGEDENVAALCMHLRTITDLNGLPSTTSREARDPTRLGVGQAGGAFAEVDPQLHPDHPRLWQQNAYYWIATEWDPLHPGNEIVAPHVVTSAGVNALDTAAILRRLDLLAFDAGSGTTPLDAWIAMHTNAAQDKNGNIIRTRRGFDVMYLDVRPTAQSPAPGAAGYVEANTTDRTASTAMATAIARRVSIPNRGANTYWSVQGNTTKELADTTHHWRDGSVSASIRAAAPAAGLVEVTFPPGNQAADFPVAFVELGFHTSPEDASCLAQEWFRFAGATGMAFGLEAIVGQQSRQVDADDVRALLQRAFGGLPSIAALTGGTPMTTATAADWIRTVGGGTPAVASLAVADVVSAIEAATVTRRVLARTVADAAATAAGWPTDAAHADDRMRAAYGPVLALLGTPPPTGVPSLSDLPRADQPASRRDFAAALGAALGRPATLAEVTAAAVGVTQPAAPERPDAQLAAPTLDAAAIALAALEPTAVLRLHAARVTTTATGQRAVTVDLAGTAWPGAARDVSLSVTRGNTAVASLTCATRTPTVLTSDPWTPPTDTSGLTVSARIVHPTKGARTLAAVPLAAVT